MLLPFVTKTRDQASGLEAVTTVHEPAKIPSPDDDPSAAPNEPVVDLDHLFGFTDGDLQLERELSALFLSSTQVYLERMHHALQSGEDWSKDAHALKGASANFGAKGLAGLAQAAEHSAPSETQLTSIATAMEAVKRFFEARLG